MADIMLDDTLCLAKSTATSSLSLLYMKYLIPGKILRVRKINSEF